VAGLVLDLLPQFFCTAPDEAIKANRSREAH
jgi:hypothetical protein